MYSDKVKEHFTSPQNLGEMKDPDATGKAGNPVCGDVMEIYLKVENGRIKDIKFKTFGCAAAIATTSMVTTLAKGMKLEDAKKLTFADVKRELGGLPCNKVHCSELAVVTLRRAIEDYAKRTKNKKPETENQNRIIN